MVLFRWLTTAALLLCFMVVVAGAYVRLSDAGLGCPDWPGCYGRLVVPAEAQSGISDRPLEHAKAWKEMNHRYLASSLGLLIVLMALVSRFSKNEAMPRKLPWVLVALVVFQGLLGMWTVTLLLKPLVVTAHLLGGMTTLALLGWQFLSLRNPAGSDLAPSKGEREYRNELQAYQAIDRTTDGIHAAAPPAIRFLATLGLALLACQIFLGGWTSSNYAALACPDLPACQGQLWPELDVKEAFTLWRGLGVNYEYGVLDNRARVTIHYLHRVGALVVSAFLFVLGVLLWRYGGVWKRLGIVLLAVLSAQVLLGISLVLFQLPLALAAAHNAVAALLLLTVITLNHYAWRQPE